MFGRTLLASLLAATSLAFVPAAFAAEPTAPAAAEHVDVQGTQAAPEAAPTSPAVPTSPAGGEARAYSTAETDIGTLLDNPATKAVLAKHVPQLVSNPTIDNARPITLKEAQKVAGAVLTDKVLAQIDADLAKVPAGS